jgi:hypothetical protein
MAEVINKTLQTRIALKYDTLANWEASSIILKKGEIAIVEFENQHIMAGDHKPANTPPAVSMKVGDGEKTFNQLPYVQAIAGDVYNWAKQAEKPVYIAGEIQGIDEYIEERERDTKYVLTEDADKRAFVIKEVDKTGAATGTTYTIDWSDLDATIAQLRADLTTLETVTMPNAINAAIEDLDADDAVEYAGEGNTGARKIVMAVDTENGIAKAEKAFLVKEDIPVIEQSQVNGLEKALEDMEAAYKAADEVVLAAAKKYTDDSVAALEDSLDVTAGTYKAATGKMVDDIYEENGLVKVEYRDLTTLEVKSVDENGAVIASTLKDELDAINTELGRLEDDKQDNLAFVGGEYNAESNKVVLQAYVDDLVASGVNFRGVVDNTLPAVADYEVGDIVILHYTDTGRNVEYILAPVDNGNAWYELGDEGMHISRPEFEEYKEAAAKALKDLEDAHKADKEALEKAIADGDAATLKAAKEYTDGELGNLDFVAAENGAAAHKFVASFDQEDGLIKNVTFAQPVIDDVDGLPAAIKALQDADKALEDNKQDNLGFAGEYNKETNPVATKNYVDEEIKAAVNDVDFGVDGREQDTLLQEAADATEATKYKVLVGFEVQDGALKEGSVVSQEISNVAVTGNVHDLIQTEVLFLDCGSASTVI